MNGRVATAVLCALVLAAPLAIGGVHPSVQVALCALVALWAIVELVGDKRPFQASPLLWPALAACAYTALQLVPWPAGLVALVSPAAATLRQGASFMPLTVDAPATMLALMRITALTTVLCLGTSALRTSHRARAVLWTLAGLGAVLCALTAISRAFDAQTILGFYRPRSQPGSGVFGTFVSGNHCASVAALCALAAAGLAVESERGTRFLALVCAVLSSILVLLTMSRAGAFGLGVGGFALAVTVLSRRFGRATGILTALVLLVVATSAALWLSDGLRGRISDPSQTLAQNQKTRGWRDALALQAAYPLTGVGRGAFEAPLEAYRSDDEGVRLVYPENIILQRSTEWGVPFVVVLAVLVGWALRRTWALLPKADVAAVAAAAGVLAVVTHELADFGLEMLGVAIPTAVALALVGGRTFGRRGLLRDFSRAGSAALVVALLLSTAGGAWAMRHTLDADYQRAHDAHDAHDDDALPTLMARHPASGDLALLDAANAVRRRDPNALHALNHALLLHPANARAHALAGRALVELHRPAQAAIEFREAIGYGLAFPTAELWRLVGDDVVDAVPQRPADLMRLARDLVNLGLAAPAERASQRAVDLAGDDLGLRNARLELAVAARQPAMVKRAVDSLLAGSTTVEDYRCAVRALADVGDRTHADQVLRAGITQHPDSETLRLVDIQLRVERGDWADARTLLNRGPTSDATLEQRQQAEEISATTYDRVGDVEDAILARGRARAIARQRGVDK